MVRRGQNSLKNIQKQQDELEVERARRRDRFRILVCVNGTDPSYEGVKVAAKIGREDSCDIILLYVRRIDQGLNAGGLQVRVARQNMLEWGLDLPGIQYLSRGRDILLEQNFLGEEWDERIDHRDIFGDPLGDNKVEYRAATGRSLVLKLKTAPDVATGILDQYELGPYNLIIMGPPKRWRGELRSFIEPSSVQKVAILAPGSVLTVRTPLTAGGYLLCTDGSERSLEAMMQGAVLAHFCDEPVRILLFAASDSEIGMHKSKVEMFGQRLADKGIPLEGVDVVIGEPVRAIKDAGMSRSVIVVSDSGKSKLQRFLFGSIAFDVMGTAAQSVLNIR